MSSALKRAALAFLFATLLCFLIVPHATAQSCAACYSTAAATGAQGRAALRHGILILLFPPLGLFAGIFAVFYRRRNFSRLDEKL